MQTAPSPKCWRSTAVVVAIFAAWLLSACSHPRAVGEHGESTPPRKLSRQERAREELNTAAQDLRAEAHARYAAGLLHDLRDEDDLAMAEFEKSLLADPLQESLALDLARRHLLRKDPEKAGQILEPAAKVARSGILSAFLASIYTSLARTNEAIEANLRAIELSPSLLIGYHNLANLYVRRGQVSEAFAVLDKAGKVPNVAPQYLLELAELWLGFPQAEAEAIQTSRKKAGELLDRALETKDLPAGLRQRAADAYMLLGQNSKAIDLYVKLVQEYPQSIPIRERLADLFLQSRDAKKAAEHMEALIREEPGKYPQAYLILGNIAMQEGKFKEAEDHLRKAVVLTPKNEPAYYDLAVAQINGGRVREGLETLDEARGRFRDTFQTEFFAGIAHSRLKEYSNAVHRFTSAEVIAAARDTNRLTHLFYFQLGASHERNKDLDAAERYFRKSLAIAPGFAEALNYLGYMWAEAGIRLKEALPLIEKAVELEPKNAAFLDSLAWVHFKLGDPKEAMVWMKKCIEHSAEPDPTLFDHLGDIHAALGNLKEAAGAWKKSIEIEPSSSIETKLKDAEKRLSSP